MTSATPPRARGVAAWAQVVVGAAVLGVVTMLAHEHGRGSLALLGDSAALWLAFAFFVGARALTVGRAVAAGALGLACTVTAYYGALLLFAGRGDFASTQRFWLIAAVVGGPVFGLFGRLSRSARPAVHGLGAAALGAALLAEAATYTRLDLPLPGLVVEAVAGAAVPFLLGRTSAQRIATLCWLPALLALGLAGWFVVLALFPYLT